MPIHTIHFRSKFLRHFFSHWVVAVTVLAILSGCANGPPATVRVAQGDDASVKIHIEKLIAWELQKHQVPGLSIALVDDQRVIWAQGYGLADVANQVPATADTLYRAGSISKLFTGAAVLTLAEQGKLDIDQPVSTYLPAFQPDDARGKAITLRQILTHHAGLPRDQMQGMYLAKPTHFSEALELLNREPLAYPPGQVFSYSNLGFSLLGSVVQAFSGMGFEQYIHRALLAPLGMSASAFEPGPSASPMMAKAYQGQALALEPALRDLPAGGLNTSVRDMARFIRMMLADGRSGGKAVLQPDTVAAMFKPQNKGVPLDMGFDVGLPWLLSTLGSNSIQGAGPVAHHAGATIRYRSQMYVLPQQKLGVIVMANSDHATGVVDRVATETLKLALQAKSGITQTHTQRPAWDDSALTSHEAQGMAGDYTTVAGLVRLRAEGRKLYADMAGKTLAVRKRADGLFGLDYAVLGLVSIDLGPLGDIGLSLREQEGRRLLVGSAGGQDMLMGERLGSPPALGAWRNRLGDYVISNPDLLSAGYQVRLAEERGYLSAEITHPKETMETGKLLLKPISDTRALALQTLADGGESVWVVNIDGQEHLSYSGYRLRRK